MQVTARVLRPPKAFEQQVVETEGEIKGRLAVPGAFRVDEQWPLRTDQDVFRADVAMHQRTFGRERGSGQCVQLRRQIGMHAAGRHQIGLEPDGVEGIVIIELGGDARAAGGGGVDGGEPLADCDRGRFAQHAVAQLALPVRIERRLEILHHEQPGVAVLRHEVRCCAGPDFLGRGEPPPFGVVALDRRFPDGGHLELGERALHAVCPRAGFHPPDVGRNAAVERHADGRFVSREQAHTAEHGGDRAFGQGIAAR